MSPLSQVLLHHGHVESAISEKNPLLGVIIYDSCRDDPKDFIKKKLDASKQSSGYIIKSSPNLVIGYGTMANMKSFEENDTKTGNNIGDRAAGAQQSPSAVHRSRPAPCQSGQKSFIIDLKICSYSGLKVKSGQCFSLPPVFTQ